VADEHHRPAGVAPRGDQRGDVGLAVRVVALAPVGGVVEAALHVDDEQGGAARILQGGQGRPD
jgi:hypothetical protein